MLAALLAPTVAPHPPTSGELAARLRPPAWQEGGSTARLLGSDVLGRDVLSRLIWGARISLLIAIVATGLGAAVGSAIGMLAGYHRLAPRHRGDRRGRPPSQPVLIVVLAVGSWVAHARIVRGLVLSLREREYVQAAQALGAGTPPSTTCSSSWG